MYAQNKNLGKPNNIAIFGSSKAKGPKQDSQKRLRLPMSNGDEPYLEITLELFCPIFLYKWSHLSHAYPMKF